MFKLVYSLYDLTRRLEKFHSGFIPSLFNADLSTSELAKCCKLYTTLQIHIILNSK